MLDIVRAIAHCHAQNVIHRDIKPENIMVDKNHRVKLLDFGLSKNAKGVKDQQICGTPFYMAPEMILGEYYDTQVDVWSLGVLLYSIVSGHMPFPAETQDELFAKIAVGKFKFEHKEFAMVSDECKDLISKMLVRNPTDRLTATKVLQHEWFQKFAPEKEVPDHVDKLDNNVFQRLRSYKGVSYFQRAAMNILVKMSSQQDMHKMTQQFKALDLDGTGLIHAHELKAYIKSQNMDISDDELKRMMEELDYAGNGKINYSEFLAATIDTKTFFDDSKLRVVFSMFDVEGNNKITAQEMHFAF